MSSPLVPNRFLFSFEFPLRYRRALPPLDGRLEGWTDAERLPALGAMDGHGEFAPVWACWNETGLAFACRVEGRRSPLRCDPRSFWTGDNVRLCVDTRPSPDNKRATRFCRQFFFLPTCESGPLRGETARANQAVAGVHAFQRAREEAPAIRAGQLHAASHVTPTGYNLESFISSPCLTGFDPGEHRRMGFYYIIEDTDLGQQYLTVGDDLLWYVDPSTWPVAELQRDPSGTTCIAGS